MIEATFYVLLVLAGLHTARLIGQWADGRRLPARKPAGRHWTVAFLARVRLDG